MRWNNFILCRRSKKWQLVQKRFFKRQKKRKTSLRWATSIINKFMYVAWDIWNFRNSLLHDKGGVNERATNKELNLQIREEFTIGTANLQDKDKKNSFVSTLAQC